MDRMNVFPGLNATPRALAAGIACVLAACSTSIESPVVETGGTLNAVTPDLVCNAQLTTRVTLKGTGFAPLPSKVLEEPPTLLFPKVELFPANALDGDATGADPVTIPDDPESQASSVDFVSDTEMGITITEALKIPEAVYHVRVTNPDGEHWATWEKGLAVIAPPTIAGFDAANNALACIAEHDATRTLKGTGFLKVGSELPTIEIGDQTLTADALADCKPIVGNLAEEAELCTTLSFTLPQGSLDVGEYDLAVHNPGTAACVSSNTVKMAIVPEPVLTSFDEPNNALACVADHDQTRTLLGTGLLKVGSALPTVLVGGTPITVDSLADCSPVGAGFLEGVETCGSATFTMAQGSLAPGEYDVVFSNPEPAACSSDALKTLIVGLPGAEIEPVALCNAQSDQVVFVSGGTFLKVDGVLPIVTIDGIDYEVTTLTGCEPIGVGYLVNVEGCDAIEVSVPEGSLEAGEHAVVMTNPPPADCSAGGTLMVNPPPTVESVVPAHVCTGGGLLDIDGQGFLSVDGISPSVDLVSQTDATVFSASAVSCGPDCTTGPGTSLQAAFGVGPAVGVLYDLVVTNPDGCTDEAPHQVVSVIQGPLLFFVDPFVVASTVNSRITLFATSIAQPLPVGAVSIVPAGQLGPATVLQTLPMDVNFPKRVQAIVPAGTAAGVYDVYLADATGCTGTKLEAGVTVAGEEQLSLADAEPPFGDRATSLAVTIFRDTLAGAPANAPFVATPRVFLNPAASTNPPDDAVAIQVKSVSMLDGDRLAAIIPGDNAVPAGKYDVIVVNPSGEIGILADGYTAVTDAPPTIATVTPPSMASSAGQVLLVAGDDFRADAFAALSCKDSAGSTVASPSMVSGAPSCDLNDENCSLSVTVDASTLAQGDICVLRVTNSDGTYADFSAIGVTNPSLNLGAPQAGSNMTVARRGLVSSAAKATSAGRFVYAIGGDDGASTVLDSVESASVDLFGVMGAWSLNRHALNTPRLFAGSATLGRYIYVVGGRDSDGALATVERAMVLSPSEAPEIADIDVILGDDGLDAGQWIYRVAATFSGADVDNPNGESLASDEFIVRLPTIPQQKISVVLSWTPPKDQLGVNLPNVAGYRIYRTPVANGASGSEVLLAAVGNVTTFTDDASGVPGADVPLPLGSTGTWHTLAELATAREGVTVSIAPDPVSPSTTQYLYAAFGLDASETAVTSYEYLPITVAPNGHQTVAGAWTTGAQTGTARWHHMAWVVDATVQADVASGPNGAATTYLYVGGGLNTAGTKVATVLRALVTAGGELDGFTDTGESLKGGTWVGSGTLAAAEQLFILGGEGGPATKGLSASIINSDGDLANNSWNAGLNLSTARQFMGTSVQSAFAFFLGGATDVDAATTSTEFVIW